MFHDLFIFFLLWIESATSPFSNGKKLKVERKLMRENKERKWREKMVRERKGKMDEKVERENNDKDRKRK